MMTKVWSTYVFGDVLVPHLIKLLRNHFLDSVFCLDDKIMTKETFEEIRKFTKDKDLNIANKIQEVHLTVKDANRQKVKYAAQLFSHINSCAMNRLGSLSLLQTKNWIELAELTKLINDWFDIFNSKIPQIDARARTSAYGFELTCQNDFIVESQNSLDQTWMKKNCSRKIPER